MKIALLLLTFATLMVTAVRASDLITYQGKLTNSQGAALADGTYRIGIRIWDVSTGGTTPLWARKYNAPVVGGLFSLMVGAQGIDWLAPAPLTASLKLAISGTNRFVEVTVMSDANGTEKPESQWQALGPRQSLGAVPYAMNGVPPGSVMAFAGGVVPDGWALCDGSAKLKSDPLYSKLWEVIGDSHGSPDADRFNLPDYQGRFLRGFGNETGRDPDRDSRTAMNPNGSTGNAVGSIQNDATKKPNDPFFVAANGNSEASNNTLLMRGRTGVGTPNPVPVGSGGDRETRPVNAYVNFIIKL